MEISGEIRESQGKPIELEERFNDATKHMCPRAGSKVDFKYSGPTQQQFVY